MAARKGPAKQITCIREWRHFDDRTLKNTFYKVGDPIHPDHQDGPWVLHPEGPDGKGPLGAEGAAAPSGPPDVAELPAFTTETGQATPSGAASDSTEEE